MTGICEQSYAVDVDTSRTPEEGAHSPIWPNGLVIIIRELKVEVARTKFLVIWFIAPLVAAYSVPELVIAAFARR
jgi:hypothetical protein